MFTLKGEHFNDKGIITKILSEVEEAVEIETWTEANSNATMYKVLDGMGKVVYLIKQYYKLKLQDGLIFKELAKKEKEISDLLCQYSPYVGRVVDVRSEEYVREVNGPVYVVTELLLEHRGLDVMQYRKQIKVDQSLLLNIFYQSALAIATAHQHGIFHCDIKPKTMVYNGHTLKLIKFDVSSIMDNETFLDKYKLQTISTIPECTPQFYPPEVQYDESVRGDGLISLGKIDVYCWGMSMLQFLTGMSEAKLGELTRNKTSNVDWCRAQNAILKTRIPQLSEETSSCIMRVIARCLEYYPYNRLNMENVLAYLVDKNEEFSPIISSLPDQMRKKYSMEINDLLHQYQLVSHIPEEAKCAEEIKTPHKKIAADKINSLFGSALEQMNQLLDSEEIAADPLFQRITLSKEEEMKIKEDNLSCLTVAIGLMKNSSLTKLNLRDNNIGDTGAKFIAIALELNSTLTKLNLHNIRIGDTGAKYIAAAIQSNSTLTKLNLGYNKIGGAGAEFLSTALQSNSTLIILNFKSNNIGVKGTEFLSIALQSNSTLTELYLNSNQIGDTGAKFLSIALQSNSTLTELYLEANKFCDAGIGFLAAALQSSSTLTKLSLGFNKFGVAGVELIATALQSNSALTELYLRGSNIDDTGAEFIATALQSNSTLSLLNLIFNHIGDTGTELIATALQSNSTLAELNLKVNKMTNKSKSLLNEAAAKKGKCKLLIQYEFNNSHGDPTLPELMNAKVYKLKQQQIRILEVTL